MHCGTNSARNWASVISAISIDVNYDPTSESHSNPNWIKSGWIKFLVVHWNDKLPRGGVVRVMVQQEEQERQQQLLYMKPIVENMVDWMETVLLLLLATRPV